MKRGGGGEIGVGDRISDGNGDKNKTAEWPLQLEGVNELTFCKDLTKLKPFKLLMNRAWKLAKG